MHTGNASRKKDGAAALKRVSDIVKKGRRGCGGGRRRSATRPPHSSRLSRPSSSRSHRGRPWAAAAPGPRPFVGAASWRAAQRRPARPGLPAPIAGVRASPQRAPAIAKSRDAPPPAHKRRQSSARLSFPPPSTPGGARPQHDLALCLFGLGAACVLDLQPPADVDLDLGLDHLGDLQSPGKRQQVVAVRTEHELIFFKRCADGATRARDGTRRSASCICKS